MTSHHRLTALMAVIAFALVAVAGVALRPLIPIDETRYIDVAWEMRLEHHWLLPVKNYGLYTDKPPLLFWLINLVWSVTGVQGFSARLVGPAFGLLAVIGTGLLGRRLWDGRTGLAAATILAGTSVFAIYGGLTMFDTMLACATLGGIAALWRALRAPGLHLWAWLGYGLALAFGVYAKGPAILLHLVPALVSWPLWAPVERPSAREVLKGAGLAFGFALVLVALWVVPAAIAGGAEYREMILWKQTAGRAVNSFAHARPLWWYVALLPVVLFPWVWSGALWRGLRALQPGDRALRLCLIWGLSGLALFSLVSGKQVHYLIPALPAFALVFGRALSGVEPRGRNWVAAGLTAVIALALAAASFGAAGAKAAAQLQPWPWVALVAAGLAALAGVSLRLRPLGGLMLLGLGVLMALNFVIGLTALGRDYDSGVIARRIGPVQDKGIAVVAENYHEEFDFEGRIIPAIQLPAAAEAPAWIAAHPGGVLLSECRDAPLPVDQAERIAFNGTDWCLWWAPESAPPALN